MSIAEQPTITTPAPGIYEGVPFVEYLGWDAVNNSSLKCGLKSMAHYRCGIDEPEKQQTDAMLFGVLAHCGMFEPLRLAEIFAVMPDYAEELRATYRNPRGSNAYKKQVAAFTEANAGKKIVDEEAYQRMVALVSALKTNERAAAYFNHDTQFEVSIVWDDAETDLRCKARVDALDVQSRRAPDLKTTADASSPAFEKFIGNLHYHRQGAFYTDGLAAVTGETFEFCLVAVETEKPYGVRSAPLDEEAIIAGRAEYRYLLRQITAARNTGKWPNYEDPIKWRLPAYIQLAAENLGASQPV